MRKLTAPLLALLLSGCAIHQFAEPSRAWTTRTGQLSYHGKARAVIGEVLVRYSDRGDFELTFSKGPGVALLTLRTDPQFARIQGLLAGLPWSGPIAQAPARARPWLALRQQMLHAPRQQSFRVGSADERLVVRF